MIKMSIHIIIKKFELHAGDKKRAVMLQFICAQALVIQFLKRNQKRDTGEARANFFFFPDQSDQWNEIEKRGADD